MPVRVFRAIAITAIFVFFAACGGSYMDPGLLDADGIQPPSHGIDGVDAPGIEGEDGIDTPVLPVQPTQPAQPAPSAPPEIGPRRTDVADAAAQRLLALLLSDVEFDFRQLNASTAAGIPISFSCIVDTSETPSIAEIEAAIKKGCGEWGLAGNTGIASGGGIAVFVITPHNGAAPQGDVVAWARAQTNLLSPQNTYAPESAEYARLVEIRNAKCTGTTIGEKVRSVNSLLFDWFHYNSGGQRDAYTCLNGAYQNASQLWGTQCDGYSRSMVALLRTWGVKARYISGYAHTYDGSSGGGAHAWVQVWNGTEWLMVDPTWNDPWIQPGQQFPDGWIEDNYLNWWMMIRTINGDRVITNQASSQGPASPKFHNARF